MAEITPKMAHNSSEVVALSGEVILVTILAADGSEKAIIISDKVPVGKSFTGTVNYTGQLT